MIRECGCGCAPRAGDSRQSSRRAAGGVERPAPGGKPCAPKASAPVVFPSHFHWLNANVGQRWQSLRRLSELGRARALQRRTADLPAGLKRTYRGAPSRRRANELGRCPHFSRGAARQTRYRRWVSLTVPKGAGYLEVFRNSMIFPLPAPLPHALDACGVSRVGRALGTKGERGET